jgi:hypothetical protein
VYRLHLAWMKDAQGRWFVKMLFVRSPPNHEAPSLFLVVTNEICLNALLSVGLFLSTFAQVFWIGDL